MRAPAVALLSSTPKAPRSNRTAITGPAMTMSATAAGTAKQERHLDCPVQAPDRLLDLACPQLAAE